MLLPNTDMEGAARCAEHIWESVGTTEIRTRQGALRLTVCAGVAALADDMKDEEELCRRADGALLIAKRRGRNNVCVWDSRPARARTRGRKCCKGRTSPNCAPTCSG